MPGHHPLSLHDRKTSENLLLREGGVKAHDIVSAAEPLIAYEHAYPERRVLLDLWLVTEFTGMPQPLDAPALRWVHIDELESAGLLEADRPMIPALRNVRT